MLQLLKISSHEDDFFPGILSDEIDDALVFGEALGVMEKQVIQK